MAWEAPVAASAGIDELVQGLLIQSPFASSRLLKAGLLLKVSSHPSQRLGLVKAGIPEDAFRLSDMPGRIPEDLQAVAFRIRSK